MDRYCLVDYTNNRGGDYVYSTDSLDDLKDKIKSFIKSARFGYRLSAYSYDLSVNHYKEFDYKLIF